MEHLGEVYYYVHEKLGKPLIVTDDDITGTFTFLRALPDYGNRRDVTAEQIGKTWLNYLIEGRTVLWWGGVGQSTEHTAYARLKRGFRPAQRSHCNQRQDYGRADRGANFIDGWAMVAPGDRNLPQTSPGAQPASVTMAKRFTAPGGSSHGSTSVC
jgi:hypothetical protein